MLLSDDEVMNAGPRLLSDDEVMAVPANGKLLSDEDVMAPVERPGRIESAVGSFARAAGKGVSDMPKSVAIEHGEAQQYLLDRFGEIDAGQQPSGIQSPTVREYATATPERRTQLRQDAQSKADPTKYPSFKLGQDIDKFIAEQTSVNPVYEQEFWAGKVPQGLGSMVSYVATGVAGALGARSGKLPGTLGSGGAVSLQATKQSSVAGFEDAIEQGANLEDAYKSSNMNEMMGYSEAVPIARILDRVDKGTGGVIKRSIVNAAKAGTEEAIQEASQTIYENLVASDLVGYDPNRGVLTGSGEGAAVGFTTGSLVQFLGTVIGGRRVQPKTPEERDAEAITNITSAPDVDSAISAATASLDEIQSETDLEQQLAALEQSDSIPNPAENIPQLAGQPHQAADETIVTTLPDRTIGPADNMRLGPNGEVLQRRMDPIRHDRGARRRLQQPDEYLEQRFREKAARLKLTPEQAAELAPQVEIDPTTGYFSARELKPVIERAQQHAKVSGEDSLYIETDISNMAGGNGVLGASQFDKQFYTPAAAIMREELSNVPGIDVIPVRKGGDENGFIIANASPEAVQKAMDTAQSRIEQLAADIGLADVPHTKDANVKGVSLYYGVSRIEPGASVDDILSNADLQVEANKKRKREQANVNRSQIKATGTGTPEGQAAGIAGRPGEKGPGVRPEGPGSQQAQAENSNNRGQGLDDQGSGTGAVPANQSAGPAVRAGVPEGNRKPQSNQPLPESVRRGSDSAGRNSGAQTQATGQVNEQRDSVPKEQNAARPASTPGDAGKAAGPQAGTGRVSDTKKSAIPDAGKSQEQPPPAGAGDDLIADLESGNEPEAPDQGASSFAQPEKESHEQEKTSQAAEVSVAANEAATSPKNNLPEPTEAQREAGNYKLGHIRINGLDISIENPAGSRRRPEWPKLKYAYGYFKGTKAKDGDHVDVFLSESATDESLPVFVIDQVNKEGKFDEHKIIMGMPDEQSARDAYLSNYPKDWTGLGAITRMSLDDFKKWIKDGDTKNPVGRLTASWVIREKATGKVIMETIDRKKVDALNTKKYEAVPIQEHLAGLNKKKPKADKGKPKHSKHSTTSKSTLGLPVASVQKVIDEFRDGLNGVPGVEYTVVKTQDEAFGDQSRDAGRIKGAYLDGRIVLVAENLNGRSDALKVLRHETLAHFGLNTLPAETKAEIIQKIIDARDSLKKHWTAVDQNYPEASEQVKAEEVFARIAEDVPSQLSKVWNEIVRIIQAALKKLRIIDDTVTTAELRSMVESIAGGIRRGGQATGMSEQPAFSRSNEWNDLEYDRVMPRDLFNEAKVLSMHMKLVEDYNSGLLPKGFEISADESLKVGLTENGELYLSGFEASYNGEPVTLLVPYNSGKDNKFPLQATAEGLDVWSATVYTESGELDSDFTEAFGEDTAEPESKVKLSDTFENSKNFMVQLGAVGLWEADGLLPRDMEFDLYEPSEGFILSDNGSKVISQNLNASLKGKQVEFFLDLGDDKLKFRHGKKEGFVLSGREMHDDFKKLIGRSPGAQPKFSKTKAPSNEGVSVSGDAATLKRLGNSLAGDAALLRNITQSDAFREHGLSGFNIPSQRVVLSAVGRMLNDRKILDSVIELIPVDVVNVLGKEKFSPDVLLHNPSVFRDLLSVDADNSVSSSLVDKASTLVRTVASVSAENIPLGLDHRDSSNNGDAAAGAGELLDASLSESAVAGGATEDRLPLDLGGVSEDLSGAVGAGKKRHKDSVTGKATPGEFDPSDPNILYSKAVPTEFSEENRRLREENKTAWNRAKKYYRRNFMPGGLLPKDVFDEKIKRDSEIQVVEFDINHLTGSLENIVKQEYGQPFEKLDRATILKLNRAMVGKVDPDIKPRTMEAIVAMRQYIDSLSREYVFILEKQRAELEAEGSELAQAKAGLIEVITGNIGTYAHRSYRAFDDKNWYKKIPDATLNGARKYLVDQYVENGETREEATRMAEVTLHEMTKNGTAYSSMDSFIRESKLGAKDLTVLKKRKQIAPEIRALLGEYIDPRVNFAKSATKMGRLVWNERFLERMQEIGMGVFLFEGKNRPPEATVQIAGDGSDVYAPLNGLWTYPEIDQAFKDALTKEKMSDLYRVIVQLNGLVKYGKTVLSPTTAARNWQSAMFFALANGHFDMRHMAKSISGLKEYFTNGGDKARLDYLRKLKKLGVVYDTPYAGEMMRLLEESRIEDMMTSKASVPYKAFRSVNKFATKAYQYGDDFWKIIGFENEKAALISAGMKEAEAEVEAADRIRNTYPTYSMVGRAINWLRRFPFVGTFVSFPAEIIRTQANILRYIHKDWTEGRKKLALRRIAGQAIAASTIYGLAAITKAMFGVDDEEEEAVRLMAAPWERNSNLLFTGRDENGQLQYIDLSFLDPYNYFKRPITAILRDQPWEEAAADVFVETLKPFLGTDIAAGAIGEALYNKKETGQPVYNEFGTPIEKTVQIANHLRKALQPGIAANIERTWKAIEGEKSSSGRAHDLGDEMFGWVGWRFRTLEPKTALYYRSFEFADAKVESTKTLNKVLRDPNDVDDDEIRSAYQSARRQQAEAYREMSLIVEAAKKNGLIDQDIRRVLKSSNLSDRDVRLLLQGRVPRLELSKQSLNNATKKAKAIFDDETAQEIKRRYRTANQLSREQEE